MHRFALALVLLLVPAAALAGPGAETPAGGGHCPAEAVLFPSARGLELLGHVNEALIATHFPDWSQELEGWAPDSAAVTTLAKVDEPVDILCVLGTWCGDSRREVPRFWRLLAGARNPRLELAMVAVGRADDADAREALAGLHVSETDDYRAEYRITNVPTFIVSHGGEEIGRIVETPTVSLGADLVAILAQAGVLASDDAATSGWH